MDLSLEAGDQFAVGSDQRLLGFDLGHDGLLRGEGWKGDFELPDESERDELLRRAAGLAFKSALHCGGVEHVLEKPVIDFIKATYGFTKDNEDTVLSATSPFTFSEISESAIFRFLKLIECDNGKIGTYTKLVKDRNASAHPNGVIQYAAQKTLDLQIAETLRVVDEIQRHSMCVIQDCYRQFLLDGNDPEDREYPDDADQIREVLIHENYLSQKDIEICIALDISEHVAHQNLLGIESLHQTLCATYGEPEAAPTQFAEIATDLKR